MAARLPALPPLAGGAPRARSRAMPRWLFVILAAALFLSVAGIVLTFLRTGPTDHQPSAKPSAAAPRGAAP